MTIEVDKGLPIPGHNGGRRAFYPWNNMNVGDSFFVQNIKIKSVTGAASSYGRNHGMRFTARTVEGGVRVWRVE